MILRDLIQILEEFELCVSGKTPVLIQQDYTPGISAIESVEVVIPTKNDNAVTHYGIEAGKPFVVINVQEQL